MSRAARVRRPSKNSGADALADPVEGRSTLVVGERDTKPDGRCPGRDSARRVAQGLASKSREGVRWALPPTGAKDFRAWLQTRIVAGLDLADTEACRATGQELPAALLKATREVKPERQPPQAELLVRLALERYELGRDAATGEAFAVARDGVRVPLYFSGRGGSDTLRAVLARGYRRAAGKPRGSGALACLAGQAEVPFQPAHGQVLTLDRA